MSIEVIGILNIYGCLVTVYISRLSKMVLILSHNVNKVRFVCVSGSTIFTGALSQH